VPAAPCAHVVYDARPGRGGKENPGSLLHAIEGRTKEQKRALIKDITDAVVKNSDLSADAVLVEIISSRDNKAKGSVLSANAEQRQQTFQKLVSLRSAARVRCLPSLIDLLGSFGRCNP
jgi:4-oxalocrotonate tautomerase